MSFQCRLMDAFVLVSDDLVSVSVLPHKRARGPVSVRSFRALAQRFDFLDDFVADVQHIGDDDIAAFFGDAQGAGPAQAACPAGDDGDAPLFGRSKA